MKKGNLNEEQVEKLKSLDVELLNFTEANQKEKWLYNYSLLKNFWEENKRFPADKEMVDSVNMYRWILTQKSNFKAGKLQEWQIKMQNAK